MDIYFVLEIALGSLIVFSVLVLVVLLKRKKNGLICFFQRHIKILSPDMICYYRMYGGIPVALLFDYGLYLDNKIVILISSLIFILLAVGDALDGEIARALEITTKAGASLDAKADKWFDLPALYNFCLVLPLLGVTPIEISNIIIVIGISIFDYLGQIKRGMYSPSEAGIVGKIKTTDKFIVIYLMNLNVRYQDIYYDLNLEIFVPVLLFSALILASASMALKTKWYNEYLRKYWEEYLK